MSRRTQIFLALAIVAFGAFSARLLSLARTPPPRQPSAVVAPLVTAVTAIPEDLRVEVHGHGTVTPRTEIEIVPQVSGRAVAVHPQLVAGGTFARGELLLSLETIDFELAVRRADAAVARAEVRLESERAEAEVAREEWRSLSPDEEPTPLTAREPQLRQAEAELAAARADLQRARIDLERTRILAPFAGRVVSKRVDPGQMVVAGQSVARIHATSSLEVPVPLDSSELEWIEVGPTGSTAEVAVDFAGVRHRWAGRAVRIEGVDPRSRMVTVAIAVEDEDLPGRPRLLPGLFADVAIRGRTLAGTIPVPRHALHGGDVVWVATDDRLDMRPVEVARAERDVAWLRDGIAPGERVVTTPLDAATDGMAVRLDDALQSTDSGAPGDGD